MNPSNTTVFAKCHSGTCTCTSGQCQGCTVPANSIQPGDLVPIPIQFGAPMPLFPNVSANGATPAGVQINAADGTGAWSAESGYTVTAGAIVQWDATGKYFQLLTIQSGSSPTSKSGIGIRLDNYTPTGQEPTITVSALPLPSSGNSSYEGTAPYTDMLTYQLIGLD